MDQFVRAPKNESDLENKILFTRYLEKRGFKVIEPNNPMQYFDLIGIKDGIHYVFELKRRWFDSTQYGDTIVELNKITKLKQLDFEKGTKSYVVNLFKDCFHIHSIDEMVDIQVHQSPKSTYLENNTPIIKLFVSYKNTDKSRREYE